MNYKEEGLKVLREQLEKQGASKHDIAVTLAFNDTVVENIHTYVAQIDNPLLAIDTMRVISKLCDMTAITLQLMIDEGDTNNDNNNRR